MFSNIVKSLVKSIGILVSIVTLSSVAYAQTTHTIKATIGTPPSGPNSDFTVNLTMSPSDVNLAGFSLRIGYDNTKVSVESVTDNTGQPGAGVSYTIGMDNILTGVSYANTYNNIIMSTTADLTLPVVNVAQINFRTTASYNDPTNRFDMYLTGYGRFTPGGVYQGDPNRGEIPTAYVGLEPASGIQDWGLY